MCNTYEYQDEKGQRTCKECPSGQRSNSFRSFCVPHVILERFLSMINVKNAIQENMHGPGFVRCFELYLWSIQ